jgi:integrase
MTTEAKRGRPVKGRVFKRGRAYYLRFRVAGKERTLRLVNPATQTNVTEERMAWRVAETILAPYKAREMVTLRQKAAEALRTAEDGVVEAERMAAKALRRKVLLSDLLERFPPQTTEPSRAGARVRPLSDVTRRAHGSAWKVFNTFMATQYPLVKFAEDVTPDHARAFTDYVLNTRGHARASLNNMLGKLALTFRRAKVADPFAEVPRYATANEHESRVPLSVEELRRVCGSAAGELRTLLAVGVFTGLRLGDCCTLTWSDHIRLEDNRLIRRTAKRGNTVAFPLHPALRAILEEIPTAARHGYVMPDLAAKYSKGASDVSGLVTKHFRTCGLETVRPAGSALAPRCRGVSVRGFHALRHTFITLCAQAGVPQGAIAEWIGHTEAVSRLYAHWGDRDTDERILRALPTLSTAKALPAGGEPERDELAALVRSADIETVRDVLSRLKGGRR